MHIPIQMFKAHIEKTYDLYNKEFSNALVRQKVNEQLKAAKAKPSVSLSDFHKQTTII